MEFSSFHSNDNISYLEEKIFKDSLRKKKLFNKFIDIDNAQLKKIAELSTNFYEQKKTYLMSQNYTNVLNYLSTPYGKEKLAKTKNTDRTISTYDENLAFIITCCDPECKMFKTYLACDNSLTKTEKNNVARNSVGFFSKRIVYAERDYYFKFINKLLTDVKVDNSNYINLVSPYINSFNTVSQERFIELYDMAVLWRNKINKEATYTTCLYNIINQASLLGLNNIEEKFTFFISTIDPELHLLDIYEEECRFEFIEKRSLEELGFYNKNLIKIEKTYQKHFYPNDNKKYIK